jgi:signal transduction histidine kinase
MNHQDPFNSDDLPLAKEIAGMLTLEIRRFLLEKNKGDVIVANKTLSIVSHELKTPVTSLKTILQVLQRRLEGDPANFNFADNAEYIGFSLREIDRLTVLVNDLLDFNRINRGALQFNFSNMDIQPIVAKAVERMQILCTTHSIRYVGGEVSCIVNIDAPRFEQALDNFLTNAIKYSPKGSTVLITVTKSNTGVTIAIHNDGEGIPENEQGRLFEPYYRTPTAEASGIGGLGIGLFISKQIVEACKGTISLTSKIGEGATVTVTLPRSSVPESEEVTHKMNSPLPVVHPPSHQ